MEEQKKRVLIPIMLVIMILLCAICCKFWLDARNAAYSVRELSASYNVLAEENRRNEQRAEEAEDLAEEYKASHDRLAEENGRISQLAEAAERSAKEYKAKYDDLILSLQESAKKAEEYQTAYNLLVSQMFDGACLANKLGHQTINVWHNAIWKEDNVETDPFTKSGGVFVTDFNLALQNLFADEAYKNDIADLYLSQLEVKERMKEMTDPPAEFENAFAALEGLYHAYKTFTDIVIYCEGSFNSYSSGFEDADKDFRQKYYTAELYVK